MLTIELGDAEKTALVALLKQAIAADPCVSAWKIDPGRGVIGVQL
jgi:hypothetical protein